MAAIKGAKIIVLEIIGFMTVVLLMYWLAIWINEYIELKYNYEFF